MNCQLCQKDSDAYHEGRLSSDIRLKIEEHLLNCADCKEWYTIQMLEEEVINVEKAFTPDPDLTSRIMAQIENQEQIGKKVLSPFTRVLRPVLIVASMAAAIFVGVLIGNIYNPSPRAVSIPVELALMNDVAIESVNVFSNE